MSGATLRRVNNDSTWLLTISTEASFPTSTFNVLIDPWLDESRQVDYHAAFSGQKRTSPALASSFAELEAILQGDDDRERVSAKEEGNEDCGRLASHRVDAILLSHPFTDHAHPATLRDPSLSLQVPFLVTGDSKVAVESMLGSDNKGTRTIIQLEQADYDHPPNFLHSSTDGCQTSKGGGSQIPSNVEILQINTQEKFSLFSGAVGAAWPKLHGAIVLLWKGAAAAAATTTTNPSETIHSLLYSPHGIASTSIPTWLRSNNVENHAIMTSLDRIILPKWLSGPVNLGLPAALDLITANAYDASHIVATHDERKEAKGLVASLLKRYWLGSDVADDPTETISELKERDKDRQRQGQEAVDSALAGTGGRARLCVLAVGETLNLERQVK